MSSSPVSSKQPSDPAPDPDAFRAALRRERIAARQAMAPADRDRRSLLIERHLTALLQERQPATLAFCWPMRGEFDCRPLTVRLLATGWRACQPVVVANGAPMVFRPWTADAPMTRDSHGIPIPATAGIVVPDVVLLPLVAFDEAGYRLGYGGGYFDRTLAALTPRPLAIGVGFELARTASIVPQDHDIPLDAVVTEAGVFRFGATG
jgi:5,10-methenyltetrahydrofolate synthetase